MPSLFDETSSLPAINVNIRNDNHLKETTNKGVTNQIA
jgi:hypothetical protein